MKKFYGILLCLALMALKTDLQAQTCAGVTTSPVRVEDRVGPHRYFTVRAMLNQIYGQDVTVAGYIDAPSMHVAYSVTIAAGNLQAETSTEFRQIAGDIEAPTTTITSVTPCPPSSGGIDATTLGEKHNQVVDYLNSYDFTGKSQDQFLDDVLYYTTSIIDPSLLPSMRVNMWGEIWFCASGGGGGNGGGGGGGGGGGFWDNLLRTKYDSVLTVLVQNGKISSSSKTFLYSLVSETEELSSYNAFATKINELESGYNIGSLPETEKFIVQGTLSTFKQSASYWNDYYAPDEIAQGSQSRLNQFNASTSDSYYYPDNAPTHGANAQETQAIFGLRCFWCIASKDLLGAALGFVAGNCLCLKFGAPNPVVCGAIGAVTVGALYSWAGKVCPDVCTRCRKPSPSSYPNWICQLPFLYWW